MSDSVSASASDGDESIPALQLQEWEHSVIDLFVNASQLIGLPKSVAQIYGLLFCRENPMPMDDIVEELRISKGSASQGLKTLRQIGAVKVVFVLGDRRDHFIAETKLRQLVSGFLADQVEPHLKSGRQRLEHLETLMKKEGAGKHAVDRLKLLKAWHDKASKVIPFIRRIL